MIGRREVRGGVLGKVILPIGKDIEGLLELISVQLERHNYSTAGMADTCVLLLLCELRAALVQVYLVLNAVANV